MKRTKRINPKRKTPRRTRPELFHGHKRERLHGAARSARRAEIFERAGGRCEEIVEKGSILIGRARIVSYGLCGKPATEWSHMRHGQNKCDCYSPKPGNACSIASCHDCHEKRGNAGGKPIAVRKRDIKMEVA